MTTNPRDLAEAQEAFARAASTAAAYAAYGGEDDLVTLPVLCPVIPGERTDPEGVRLIPAITVLRMFVEQYDELRAEPDPDDPQEGHVHHVDTYGDPVPAETYAVKCDGGEDCPDRIGEQEEAGA